MGFGQQLRAAREKNGMTQQQVANILGIDKTTYSGYETSKREPDVFKIKALAKLFGVSGDELLETGFSPKRAQIPTLTEDEITHIKKYRRIDSDGKATIDMMLDQLVKTAEAEQPSEPQSIPDAPRTTYLYAAKEGGAENREVDKRQAQKAFDDLDALPRHYNNK